MVSLTQDLHRLRQASSADRAALAEKLYHHAVLFLLQQDPFYGRTLSHLTLRQRPGREPLALIPTASEWQLGLAPVALAQTTWTGREFLNVLRHTVLHLLWGHPARYAAALRTPAQVGLVRWATDAAVNDFLTDLPSTAITSQRLAQVLGQPVQPRQDSSVYLRQLRAWRANQTATSQQLALGGPQGPVAESSVNLDGHGGWRQADATTAENREQWRSQLFQSVTTAMPAKQRGTLPGQIQAALTATTVQHPLNWRSLLKRGLGQVPAGRQPAYGRFNRRQPIRMELPGTIAQTWRRVAVFVDESGSMGNTEVSYLLGQLTALAAVYPAQITVYPFDTTVDWRQRFSLTRQPQHRQRTGGGGTRFQAVFDALPRLMAGAPNQLVIILTDGYGEAQVQLTRPATVIWLLTSPVSQFSVKQAPGTVVSLADDPQWQMIRGQFS